MKKKMQLKQFLKDFAAGAAVTFVWAMAVCVILWPLVQLVNWIM